MLDEVGDPVVAHAIVLLSDGLYAHAALSSDVLGRVTGGDEGTTATAPRARISPSAAPAPATTWTTSSASSASSSRCDARAERGSARDPD